MITYAVAFSARLLTSCGSTHPPQKNGRAAVCRMPIYRASFVERLIYRARAARSQALEELRLEKEPPVMTQTPQPDSSEKKAQVQDYFARTAESYVAISHRTGDALQRLIELGEWDPQHQVI